MKKKVTTKKSATKKIVGGRQGKNAKKGTGILADLREKLE